MIIYTWKVNRVRFIKERVGLFKKRKKEITENLISMHYTDKNRALDSMNRIDQMTIDGFRRFWIDYVASITNTPFKMSPEVDGYYETYVTQSILFED